jgi:hypothetical protein
MLLMRGLGTAVDCRLTNLLERGNDSGVWEDEQ